MKPSLAKCITAAGFALAAVLPIVAYAQFPDRPVSMYVGYPPGGTADRTARVMATVMARELKQTVIVENKAGGTQLVGARAALAAKPDGHTVFWVAEIDFLAKVIGEGNPGFELSDFASLCGTSFSPYIFVLRANAPWNTLEELVAHLKKAPESVTYGSSGLLSGHHMVLQFLQQQAGVKLLHVPYQGGGPVLAAMLGGQIDAGGGTWGLWRAQVLAGKVKPLIVLGAKRMKDLPDVPSFGERGFNTSMNQSWMRLLVHKDTPPAIQGILSKACEGLTRDPAAQETLRKSGLEPDFIGAAETTRAAKSEADVIRSLLGSLASGKPK